MFCKPMLYFGVCLSLRALIAYAFYRGAPARFLPIMGVLAIMVAIGFMSIYLFEWRQGSVTETGKGCTFFIIRLHYNIPSNDYEKA